MKTKSPLIILVVILLASCAPAPAIIEPTATKTLIPTVTFTPEPTVTNTPDATPTDAASPTPTEAAVPDWMKPFIDAGYDKKVSSGYIYIMNTEGSTQYASSNDGIEFNGLQIFSWTTNNAYYDEQGVLHTDGIILDGVCREVVSGQHWAMMVDSNSTLNNPVCPSLAFWKNTRTEIERKTVGNHQILKGSFGEVLNKDKTKIFAEIFPNAQPVFIPGIGTVLPIIHEDYEPGIQWTK